MNFKSYDILSSLVPGFLGLLVLLPLFDMKFDKDLIVAYTAVAFLIGFLLNTLGSWFEFFYFWTWGGKPSDRLVDGKDTWKVRFYEGNVKSHLQADCGISNVSNDQLFQIAMRTANGNVRVDDFNASYAFARVLLTTVLFGSIFLLSQRFCDWRYWVTLVPTLFILWLRCKQRAYYYAREVLNVYLKSKS